MNRKHLSLAALAVVLVALGIALLPFGWRDPYKARVDCSPAAVSAWQTKQVPDLDAPRPQGGGAGSFLSFVEGPAKAAPTKCAEKARIRLETSGVLLGLTALGLVAGRRILRPEVLPVG